MAKIELVKNEKRLCEIYSSGFQFTFLSKDYKQCHHWVLCKDFLTDVIWSTVHNKSVSIYGFSYNPKENPKIDVDDNILIAVRNKQVAEDKFDKEINQCIKFLNIVERRLKIPESTIEKAENKENCIWIFKCDKKWIIAPPMLSLLTLFIRVGCHYTGGGRLNAAIKDFKTTVKHNDASYLKRSRNLRLKILKEGIGIFGENMKKNWPSADIGTVHDSWGIVNYKMKG